MMAFFLFFLNIMEHHICKLTGNHVFFTKRYRRTCAVSNEKCVPAERRYATLAQTLDKCRQFYFYPVITDKKSAEC